MCINDHMKTYPWTGIADVQMVATLFNGKLGAGFLGDPVAERAGLPFELARLVAGLDPICDFEAGSLFDGERESQS